MIKRKLIIVITCIATMAGCMNQQPSEKNTRKKTNKPNFVMILADDLGWAQLGCYGSDYYKTPHIDKLAEQGMTFTNAYSAAAVCSPTRASIMTGKHPARLHLTDFIAGNPDTDYPLTQPEWTKYLPLEERCIAEVMKKHGYQTALFGKWHLSKEKTPLASLSHNPDKQGFDEHFVTYKPVKRFAREWQTPEDDPHNVDTITNLSLDFMERNKDKPFLLIVSHNSIHDPLVEAQSLIEKYEAMPASSKPENHPVVAAMIEVLDKSVGRVMDKMEQLDLNHQTVFIFYSDNGGKHSYAAQTPFRAGKGWLYEGGIRVPLIVRWPGVIEPGRENQSLVTSCDFYPTFLDIAGIEPDDSKKMDGLSLYPVLQNNGKLKRNALHWNYPHYHKGSGMKPACAVRVGKYKLISWYEPVLLDGEDAYELYDLEKDPGEQNNLIDELPEKAEFLKNKLYIWKEKLDAQEPIIN